MCQQLGHAVALQQQTTFCRIVGQGDPPAGAGGFLFSPLVGIRNPPTDSFGEAGTQGPGAIV